MNENKVTWREKYRVRLGFIFGLIFLWRAVPQNGLFLFLGLTIALAGVLFRQWAAGCVKKMDELAQTGPYALVRHPLYLGSFLAGFGFILTTTTFAISTRNTYFDRTLFFWACFWIFIDCIYRHKIEQEEINLQAKFPADFPSYQQSVPQLFPKKLSKSDFNFSSFQISVWKKNEEYWSLVGYTIIAALLIARYVYYR